MKVVNPKTPKFYITPKINKEKNPRKPVIKTVTPLKFHVLLTITFNL